MRAGRFLQQSAAGVEACTPLTPRCEGDETHARLAPREAAAILGFTRGKGLRIASVTAS